MTLRDLNRRYKDSALNILCAAFHDYPVMRYVIGEVDPEYDGKLRGSSLASSSRLASRAISR